MGAKRPAKKRTGKILWDDEMPELYVETKQEQRSPTEDELMEILRLKAEVMQLTADNKRLKQQVLKLSDDVGRSLKYAEEAKQAYKEIYDHETERRHRKEMKQILEEQRFLKEQLEFQKWEEKQNKQRGHLI